MKNILIASLVVVIVLLIGVWMYLLINGAPEGITDMRNALFGNSTTVVTERTAPPITTLPEDEGPKTLPVLDELFKVTSRPVAGAVLASTTEGVVIRYMVKGTGHIYDVSLRDGKETRVSNQTIPNTVAAYWSPVGSRVVVATDSDGLQGNTFLGSIATSDSGSLTLSLEGIPPLENIAFSATGEVLYYTNTSASGETYAYARTIKNDDVKAVFTLPFKESIILWDIWENKTHYAFTKPAFNFMGFLYKISAQGLTKVDESKNLTALRIDTDTLMVTKNDGKGPYSLLLDTTKGVGDFLSIQGLREKCAGTNTTILCGHTGTIQENTYPISWYKGTISYSDKIWNIDTKTGEVFQVLDLEGKSREQIDVTDMSFRAGKVLFKNKRDDSLWLYTMQGYRE